MPKKKNNTKEFSCVFFHAKTPPTKVKRVQNTNINNGKRAPSLDVYADPKVIIFEVQHKMNGDGNIKRKKNQQFLR